MLDSRYVLVLIILILAVLRFYPAVTNEFPKGSDSWFHIRSAEKIMQGSLVNYDELNAGGHINSYPPGFHILLAVIFSVFDPLESSKYIGLIINVLAVLMFYLFVRSFYKEIALIATFIFGISLEIINTSMFLAPTNIGLLLIPAILFSIKKMDEKKYAYLSVILASLLAVTHPMSLIILLLFIVVLFYHKLKHIAPVLIIPVFLLLLMNMYFASIGSSMVMVESSPDFIMFITGFQFPLFIFLLFGITSDKRISLLFLLMLAWISFIPFYPERVMTFSIIPASIIAAKGFLYLKNLEYLKKFTYPVLIIILLISIVPILDYSYAKTEMTKHDYEVISWARENTQGTIASTWQVSAPWIEYVAEKKSILGPFQEAVPDYKARGADLQVLFTGNDTEARNILRKYNSSYIFVNRLEDSLLYPGSIDRFKTYFEEVQSNEYAYIFKA